MELRGEFFDWDPLTGLREQYEENSDGTISIHTYQDISPHLKVAHELRATGASDDSWKQHGVGVYAIIPPILQGALLKKGINFLDPNHTPDVVREINTNYQAFKTTYKHHEVKEGSFGK